MKAEGTGRRAKVPMLWERETREPRDLLGVDTS